MSMLVWVHDHIVWLALGIIPCAAAIGWGLWAGRYQPAHAGAGPVPERLWPLVGDPRYGSMQLADDRAWHFNSSPLTTELNRGWREVAHEEDWRDQTVAALAPAVLDSGPGGLAWPGPDPASHRDDDQGRDVRVCADDSRPAARADLTGSLSSRSPMDRAGSASAPLASVTDPDPVRTVAGRLVETRDEWLRRLTTAAGDGWTYAGVAA